MDAQDVQALLDMEEQMTPYHQMMASQRGNRPAFTPAVGPPIGPPPMPVKDIRLRLQQASTRVEKIPSAECAASADEANNECGICQDVLVGSGEDAPIAIKFNACKHSFHENCIVEWLDWMQRNKNSHVVRAKCPNCRTNIFPIANIMDRYPPPVRRPGPPRPRGPVARPANSGHGQGLEAQADTIGTHYAAPVPGFSIDGHIINPETGFVYDPALYTVVNGFIVRRGSPPRLPENADGSSEAATRPQPPAIISGNRAAQANYILAAIQEARNRALHTTSGHDYDEEDEEDDDDYEEGEYRNENDEENYNSNHDQDHDEDRENDEEEGQENDSIVQYIDDEEYDELL